jgi:hypothetical protein
LRLTQICATELAIFLRAMSGADLWHGLSNDIPARRELLALNNIRTSSPLMAEDWKDMESDTVLHLQIIYLAPCWAELFTLRSSTKTHAISTRETGVSGRELCMQSLPQ